MAPDTQTSQRSAKEEPLQPISGLEWYHIPNPDSPVLDELARRYHLHPLHVEDCRHRPQRAKTEETPGYLFFVLKHLHSHKSPADPSTGERAHLSIERFDDVDVFLGRDFLVTVAKGEPKSFDELRKHILENGTRSLDKVFYALVDLIVDEYLVALDGVTEETSDLESEVLDCPEPPMLRRIFVLKRKLVTFRRISGDMREVVNATVRRENGIISDTLDPYFRDIYDHLVRTTDLIETYRDLLTGSLDIYLSAVANRTNEVMKVLTIYGTIALPLVIITGFFGMNLPLPWQHTAHGLLFAVLLMMASTFAILYYFKRKHWF